MTCDIELKIGRGSSPGEYRVQVVHAAAGGEPEASLALDVERLLARHDELERALLASSVPARSAATTADQAVLQVGEELFRSLFDGPVNDAYRASLGVAQQSGERLRVVLRLTEPELAGLPWEMLYDSVRRAHLCLEEPIVRRIPAPFVVEPLNVQPPLRVLGLVASPRQLPALDVEAEIARLTEAIGDVVGAGLVELAWVKNATWANVLQRLLSGEWHVVHFIGHGDYDRQRGGLLAFESETGRPHLVEASQFAHLLGQAKPSPRLVVLNSCSGGEVGKEDLFSGTASTLIHSGIDAVTAMQFAVSDQAAIAFARGFYTSIASGRGVDEAVGSGRIAILGMPEVRTLEWATPVLYLRGNVTHPIKVEPESRPDAPPWLESERLYDEAVAQQQLGRHESAVRAFRRLMDHDPDYRNGAELLEQAERAAGLQPVYDDAVRALDSRDAEHALELVDQILEEVPDHRPASELRQRALHELIAQDFYDRADDKLRLGDGEAALVALDELEQHAHDYPGSHDLRRRAEVWKECQPIFDRAVADMKSGDYEAAVQGLRSVLDLDPSYPHAAAEHHRAERAVALRPTYEAAATALDQGDPDEALARVDEVLAEIPTHREAVALKRRVVNALESRSLYDRARGLLSHGDAAGALRALDALDEQDSDHPWTSTLRQRAKVVLKCQSSYERAVSALAQREYKSAVRLLDQVLELDPEYQDAAARRDEAAHAVAARRRKLLLAGGSLLVVGTAIVAWLLIPRGTPSPSTAGTASATLSDNEVVVSVGDDSEERLVAVDVDSGRVRGIDTPRSGDIWPNPSPDRGTVAYLAARPAPHVQPAPHLVGVDGSDDRAVPIDDACPGGAATVPGWSPDHEMLAEVCLTDDTLKQGTDLYTVSATGSALPHLVLSAGDDEEFGPPTWSRDGRITMWRGAKGQRGGRRGGDLISVDPATGAVRTLTEQEADTQPDWYGRDRLVFLRRSDTTRIDQIMVLDRTQFSGPGTGTTLLTEGLVKLPTWSPDGRRIAYLAQDNEDADWRLMVMDADGSDPHPVDLPDVPNSLSWGTR
jgi:tetratricopeptide (TPR) repeat protein